MVAPIFSVISSSAMIGRNNKRCMIFTAADGGYACDYAPDVLMKAASAALQTKNAAAFDFLSAFQLTTEQQSEIAGYVDRDKMTADAAAAKWVADNPDVVAAWLG